MDAIKLTSEEITSMDLVRVEDNLKQYFAKLPQKLKEHFANNNYSPETMFIYILECKSIANRSRERIANIRDLIYDNRVDALDILVQLSDFHRNMLEGLLEVHQREEQFIKGTVDILHTCMNIYPDSKINENFVAEYFKLFSKCLHLQINWEDE